MSGSHRTITLPPVTAALLAHGVTGWSTHDYRGSVEVGDRGIIVAGNGPVRSEDVPEGWFYDGEMGVDSVSPSSGRTEYPVHTRAAVAVGTVAEVVPITRCSDKRHICNQPGDALLDHSPLHEPHADGETEHDLSHLLPCSDWSPTTDTGKQRWAVRWEDMRVLDEAVTEYPCCRRCVASGTIHECRQPMMLPVPLHRGWRVADAGLIEACGEA